MDPHNIVRVKRNCNFVAESRCLKFMTRPLRVELFWLVNTTISALQRYKAATKTPCIESIPKFYLRTCQLKMVLETKN